MQSFMLIGPWIPPLEYFTNINRFKPCAHTVKFHRSCVKIPMIRVFGRYWIGLLYSSGNKRLTSLI